MLKSHGLFLHRIFFFSFIIALIGTGAAGAGVTFTWQANPAEDYVIGYRLYFGPQSRLTNNGNLKTNFSYDYYIDFLESRLYAADGTDTNCVELDGADFQCEGLYGEWPQCTVNNLQGLLYFALTAYNAQAESGYTPELGLTINAPEVVANGANAQSKSSTSLEPSTTVNPDGLVESTQGDTGTIKGRGRNKGSKNKKRNSRT